MAKSTTDTRPGWADSKTSWLTRVHDAVLPSGIKITYRDLTLAELALLDELPQDLLEIAVAEWADPGSAAELVQQPFRQLPEKPSAKQQSAAEAAAKETLTKIAALNRHMIAAALVEPKLTVDELERVPMPDLELLAALINRTVATDAAGRTLGVVPTDQFRVVLEAHGHERCPSGCPACEEARRGLATAR
jgi:hypothetical protein